MGFLPGSNHKDLQVASDHYLTDGPGGTCKALLPHSQGDLRQATASLLDYEHLPPGAGLGIRTVSWFSAHTMLGVTRSLWQTPLRWRLRRTSAPSDEGNYKSRDHGCLAFTIRTHEWGFGIFSHTLSFVCLWENILRRSLSLFWILISLNLCPDLENSAPIQSFLVAKRPVNDSGALQVTTSRCLWASTTGTPERRARFELLRMAAQVTE